MRKRKLVVVLTQDEEQPDVINVTVPALPGCFTWGFGRREALRHAKEAIELYLQDEEVEIFESDTAQVEVFA